MATLGCLAAMTSLAQTASPLAKLPLFFEANHGQAATAAPFLARTADAQCAISASGVAMNLRRDAGRITELQMKFVGANPAAEIHGDAEQSGKVNYLIGNDPAQWHAGVPTFAQVRVEKMYPGVDVVFYGNQQQLEYDFNFAAGANPNVVALRFDGADKIQLGAQGDLVISLGGGEIRQPQPQIYQTIAGSRHAVSGGYKILADQTVTFAVGGYDHSQPLVIDPVLSYSAFFGGNYGDTALAVAVDPSGYIYVAGETFSTTFSNNIPWSTTNAYQTNYHGGNLIGDAFVAKFASNGSNFVYLTYLGGSSDDGAQSVAFDAQGNTYVGGFTSSADFPTANIMPGSGLSTNISGVPVPRIAVYPTDAFMAELNTNGSRLLYSGYLGGTEADGIMGIAVEPISGTAFVTGYTYSTNFPVTASAYSKKLSCPNSLFYNANAFVAEIAPGGTNLNYSTYFGGTNFDGGRAIAFNNGTVFVAGQTASTNFPAVNYIHQFSGTNLVDGHFLNGSNVTTILFNDAFVAAFTNSPTTGLGLQYSTLLGGAFSDIAYGIAADALGNAYVVGSTTSSNFPSLNTVGTNLLTSYVLTNTVSYAATNGFLTQIQWNGTNAVIGYSALFGGYGVDVATAVALDPNKDAFVTGYASSTNFPVTMANIYGSLRSTNSGGSDVFVIAFNPNASGLLYSTYFGGAANDYGYGIAVDSASSAYVVGQTLSTNFPIFNARQKIMNGTNDAFLAKIILASPLLSASLSGTNFLVTVPPVGDLNSGNFSLETSTNLLNSTNWVVISNAPAVINGTNIFTFAPTNPARFFRFHQ